MSKKQSLQSPQSLLAKEEKKDWFKHLAMPYEPDQILKVANEELEGKEVGTLDTQRDSAIPKAMSLREFDNGILMTWGVHDSYKTFAVQLSRDYQQQYKCNTPSRKTLAELAALNYCRVLETQRRINNVLESDRLNDLSNKFIATMSKELDRAQRHYLASIQVLEVGSQPPLNVRVKAQTANIANQQAIQQVEEQTNVKG